MAARDAWFDNAKMALVSLVVVGHSWTLLPKNAIDEHLYDFLYAWHVPAFVLVTGYLSRSFVYTPTRLWQLVRTVAVPYVIFECVIALFRVYVGGEQLEDLFLDPHWPLWYLSALFFWRLLTPVFKRLRGGLVVAIAISLGAGLWAGNTLDVARVCGLLPFFVLGLKATPEHLERLRSTKARVAGVVVLMGIAVLAVLNDGRVSTEWLYYRSTYDELQASHLDAVLIRAALLVIGAMGALAFLALVPRLSGWFTGMGAATLVVYLFHGFVVKGADYAGFPAWAAHHAVSALLLTTVLGVGVAMLLAWRPVSSRLNEVVDPFGYAERHTRHAVDLAVTVVTSEERESPILTQLMEQLPDQSTGQPLHRPLHQPLHRPADEPSITRAPEGGPGSVR